MTKEIIEKVKKENEGLELFLGEISFKDENGKTKALEFVYKKPVVADMEAFNKAAAKSGFTAQSNLLNSLIVYPEPGEITGALREYPPVVAEFVEENIVPFFGSAITSKSSRI